MIALLCMASIAAGGIDLDGQAAVERAEKLLHNIGVKDSLTLTGLGNKDWSTKEPSWLVSFSMPHGGASVGLNARSGRVNRLSVNHDRSVRPQGNSAPTVEETWFIHRILSALGYGKDIDFGSDVGFSGWGPFHALVHGRPFFNLNPTYGPTLSAYDPALPSITFYASPPLPPVNAWQPKIQGVVAVEKIRTWAHARAKARGLSPAIDPSVGDLTAELGYWKVANQPQARLVWRATKYSAIEGRRYGLGALRMFVDAVTGELLEPDDPAWGMNP